MRCSKKILIIILMFFTLLLAGCAKPASEEMAQVATDTVNTMYESLPKECQTKTVENLRQNSLKEIQSIVTNCKAEKALLGQKITTRNVIILLLSVIILSYVGGKVFSRFRH